MKEKYSLYCFENVQPINQEPPVQRLLCKCQMVQVYQESYQSVVKTIYLMGKGLLTDLYRQDAMEPRVQESRHELQGVFD